MAKQKYLPKVNSGCHQAPVFEQSTEVKVPAPIEGSSIPVKERKPTAKEIKESKFELDGKTVELTLPDKIVVREEPKHQKTAIQVQQICAKCGQPTNATPGPVDKDWNKESEDEAAS